MYSDIVPIKQPIFGFVIIYSTFFIPSSHIPPVLPPHFIQCPGNLPERAILHRIH